MTLSEQLDLTMPKAVLTQYFQSLGAGVSVYIYIYARENKQGSKFFSFELDFSPHSACFSNPRGLLDPSLFLLNLNVQT